MNKLITAVFNLACLIGVTLGILHFFAPYAFQWYSYIPGAPLEIIQSINYINFCFSLFLAGTSLLILLTQKPLFAGSNELTGFYAFFVLVWFTRVLIQLIWPWPSTLQTWLVIGFTLQFILALIPLLYLLRNRARPRVLVQG